MSGKAEDGGFARLAGRLDYAFLKIDSLTTVTGLRVVVRDMQDYGFRSLCLLPILAGTVKKNFPDVRVTAVVGYPLGGESLAAKLFAVQELIEQGIDEIDVVMDLFAIVNNNSRKVSVEAQKIGEMTSKAGVFLKTIIETPILTDSQIRATAEILIDSPVDCIKTSTGYGREPTSLAHVKLLRDVAGKFKQLKVSGGVKNLYDVRLMVEAGADIIGTSNAVGIVEEQRATLAP